MSRIYGLNRTGDEQEADLVNLELTNKEDTDMVTVLMGNLRSPFSRVGPPSSWEARAAHVMQMIRTLLTVEPRHRGTNLTKVLEYVNNIVEGRALVFIISDFRASDDWVRPLRVTARRHDVVAIRVEDPRESTLPSVGLIRLQDAETGQEVVVDLRNKRVREQFEQRAALQRQDHVNELRSLGVDMITLRTDQRYADALQAFFTSRIRRRERA